ncbi:phospholipid carrier-dependent glycosyltransferase [Spirosoma sp. KCTC 42546]|uniref:glycosyltransferase family 39 protein n=1 Tax=Spirosoma sp. KCTC 42546 TaxID=2520506 RepID=UPI00115B5C38|nr:glycosyltransferase family 39 protein [Spirosoma sp. KCTC 42546]QDK82534.1 phospholipid carrier-dependent glycosyltransferase [Spirosoma sp. KCTC 42546]
MKLVKSTNAVLAVILILAFALRVYHSGTYGIYLDEKYTLLISQGISMEGANQRDVFFTPGKPYFTPREFWKEKSIDDFIGANIRGDIGNSPSYYAVLWLWTKLFGLSDFSLRFPSVLFSTLLVGLVFLFVRRHFKSERLALLSALLTAVEPFFIAYSHMARNYSMSFFLTLLATHLFLLILDQHRSGQAVNKRLLVYGLVFVMALLSHYLTITVFLCHGLYALIYVRPARRWVPFLLTGLVGVGLVSLWFLFGGGVYTFKTLAYQAQFYRNLALTDPYKNGFGIILPATLINVAERSAPIWADLFIISNGLGQIDALGIRNVAISVFLGLFAVGLLYRYHPMSPLPLWVFLLYPLLLIAALPLVTVINLQYVVVAALPSFAYLLLLAIRRQAMEGRLPLLVFVIMLAVVPTLFLIVMAFRNGHTYGITQRYSGFSFPFSVILVALLLQQAARIQNEFREVLWVVLAIQCYFVIRLLYHIYQDQEPKYTYFARQRSPNPYYLVAQKIKQAYVPGDTVLYPSIRLHPRDEIEKTYWPFSIQDAQLTNMYLPKDAEYVQRMDTTEVDKITLVKPSGKKITLFDLKGNTYRY